LAAALALIVASAPTIAQGYPTGTIRVIVPFPPGGGVDSMGRLVSQKLGEALGRQVVVENRGGANGMIGSEAVAKSPKDGHTLLVNGANFVTTPIMFTQVSYDPIRDFDPVSLMALGPNVLVVHPSLPVKSVKELIALAKARPGALNYASSGIGGFPHMNTELFKLKTGVNIVHVPFKGGGPAMVDTIAGHTQVYLSTLVTVAPHVSSGRVRILGVGSAKRLPSMPEVPTISETVPGFETYIWWGMFAPNGTPAAAISRMHAETTAAMATPEMTKRLEEQGGSARKMSSAEFGKLMVSEQAKWTDVIRAAGIKGE